MHHRVGNMLLDLGSVAGRRGAGERRAASGRGVGQSARGDEGGGSELHGSERVVGWCAGLFLL